MLHFKSDIFISGEGQADLPGSFDYECLTPFSDGVAPELQALMRRIASEALRGSKRYETGVSVARGVSKSPEGPTAPGSMARSARPRAALPSITRQPRRAQGRNMELFWLGVWVGSIVLAINIAQGRGNSQGAALLLAILLGPLAVLIALILPRNEKELERVALARGAKRKCPACAELINPDASKCRYCGTGVDPVPPQPAPAQMTRAEVVAKIGREDM